MMVVQYYFAAGLSVVSIINVTKPFDARELCRRRWAFYTEVDYAEWKARPSPSQDAIVLAAFSFIFTRSKHYGATERQQTLPEESRAAAARFNELLDL